MPVITTPIVADGLRVHGDAAPPLHVAEGERQFAECIVSLLRQQDERIRLAAEGRRFIEDNFDWSRNAAKLERMLRAAIQSNGPAMVNGHTHTRSAS